MTVKMIIFLIYIYHLNKCNYNKNKILVGMSVGIA